LQFTVGLLSLPRLQSTQSLGLVSGLGPIAIFSAKHHWTAPRVVRMRKHEHEGFGFSVRGDAHVIIAGIDIDSIAEVFIIMSQTIIGRKIKYTFTIFSLSNFDAHQT
jgi:hypothetical protein